MSESHSSDVWVESSDDLVASLAGVTVALVVVEEFDSARVAFEEVAFAVAFAVALT